ncbi:hypothetical protein ACH347_36450 [Saccharopolyspora sp. 5N102]|uniref:hypothetical protein n=1 Tax=Saccharopolyspora sp. 5N102 TaxID=3375155 RepID=UPI0037AB5C42
MANNLMIQLARSMIIEDQTHTSAWSAPSVQRTPKPPTRVNSGASHNATRFRTRETDPPKILPKMPKNRDGTLRDDHRRSTSGLEKGR